MIYSKRSSAMVHCKVWIAGGVNWRTGLLFLWLYIMYLIYVSEIPGLCPRTSTLGSERQNSVSPYYLSKWIYIFGVRIPFILALENNSMFL
jgi:hypothetical protein